MPLKCPALLLTCGLIGLMLPINARALLATCTVSATSVAFGTYDPATATPLDSTGTVTVSCNALVGLLVNWTIAASQGGGPSFAGRRLTSGANTLAYNLYTTVARTTIWGDGTSSTQMISDGLTLLVGSNTVNYTVYGRIPSQQNSAPGSYSDSITVTLNYN